MAITMELPGMESELGGDELGEGSIGEAIARGEEIVQDGEPQPEQVVTDNSPGPLVNDQAVKEEEQPADWNNLTPEERAHRCYASTLRGAETEHTEASLHRLKLEGDYKTAKKIEKELLERVQEVINQGWQVFLRKEDAPKPATEEVSQGGESPSDQPAPDAWKTVSIDELGLSGKFIDKLKDAGAGTMGGLEELRAEIAAGRAAWPKGVGEAKVTAIVDKLLPWLSEHRDAAEFQKAGGESDQAETGEQVEQVEQVAEISQGGEVEPDTEEAKLADRFAVLSATSGQFTPSRNKYRGHYDDGATAAANGQPWSDCSWTGPSEEQDNWLRGWLQRTRETADASAE